MRCGAGRGAGPCAGSGEERPAERRRASPPPPRGAPRRAAEGRGPPAGEQPCRRDGSDSTGLARSPVAAATAPPRAAGAPRVAVPPGF